MKDSSSAIQDLDNKKIALQIDLDNAVVALEEYDSKNIILLHNQNYELKNELQNITAANSSPKLFSSNLVMMSESSYIKDKKMTIFMILLFILL